MMSNLKCIHCIEGYVQMTEKEKQEVLNEDRFDTVVQDAVTLVPSWQTQMAGPGQMVMACITVPVCLSHIQIQRQTPEQIASRAGLVVPGQSPN